MRSLQPHRVYAVHLLSDLQQAADLARQAPHVLDVRLLPEGEPPQIEIDFDGDDRAVSELLARLVQGGAVVSHFAGQINDLEDIFMRVTEGSAYGGTS
jgi:ABC-2 type transport system ATP-binding protein